MIMSSHKKCSSARMGHIVHLPKSLIGQLRSSCILSDFAQAVEELMCNSLDAGAKKILAFIDRTSFYIKVEDDGSGVTRDDLVLIGERHATSKLHDLVDLESGVTTLGFRGEALSSLSDIGILEIITRVRGSPNTYKKILKGCKKLSMGLYSEQRTPGTTVILRELFHNLPVRRKVIQSSPRKVLQGVKDRVVRLALIHSDVSFTVFDIERQENLICTTPCSSPLDTLCNIFGQHLRSELREVHHSKMSLELDGFVSVETSRFSTKATQFLYLNGRFVHKTPTHKLINTLFTQGKGLHEVGTVSHEAQAVPKQVFPAFLLNLRCPLSCYDITFEATKTTVEFKDWNTILSFVSEALSKVWTKLSGSSEKGAAKCITRGDLSDVKKSTPCRRKPWQRVDPTYHPRCHIDKFKGQGDVSCFNVGREEAYQSIEVCNKLEEEPSFYTPKRTRSAKKEKEQFFHTPKRQRSTRKRRVFDTSRAGDDCCTLSWSLEPCRTRKEMGGQSEGQKQQDILQHKSWSWCEQEDFDQAWGLSRTKCDNTAIGFDVFNPYDRVRDFSPDIIQTRQSAKMAHLTRNEDGLLLDLETERCTSSRALLGTPHLLRSSSFTAPSPAVRRCLYDLGLKSLYTDDFLCHSDRQTLSNLELRSVCAKDLDFSACDAHPGSSVRQFGLFCDQDEKFSLRIKSPSHNIHPYAMEMLSAPSMMHEGHSQVSPPDKGVRINIQHFAERVAVKEPLEQFAGIGLRRTCSGPPFYRLPSKRQSSNGLEALDCLKGDGSREMHHNRREDGQGQGERFLEANQDRKVGCRKGGSFLEMEEAVDQRASCQGVLQEAERDVDCPRPNSNPSNRGAHTTCDRLADAFLEQPHKASEDRNGLHCSDSKWRVSVCDNHATVDGFGEQTAMQLYKDWRNPCMRIVEPNIVDLWSEGLGPSNRHLIPESISKEDLLNAQVLQQVDKKFIATVAEGILVVVDQHAADERVRLEQFRKEVLEEKQHLSTLLDYPQELSISMGDQQLLHTYQSQIEYWGWRFKLVAEENGRRCAQAYHGKMDTLLTAVPNILGESLMDAQDLTEYLHQLSSTDGTSAPPTAVLRIMASKACRGAIMFGDFLLRSECQQLVEGLKKTALSFRCAHGRPTLAPLVNLEALHLRLRKLHCKRGLASEETCLDGSNSWHGLQWHCSTLDRARDRLRKAEEML